MPKHAGWSAQPEDDELVVAARQDDRVWRSRRTERPCFAHDLREVQNRLNRARPARPVDRCVTSRLGRQDVGVVSEAVEFYLAGADVSLQDRERIWRTAIRVLRPALTEAQIDLYSDRPWADDAADRVPGEQARSSSGSIGRR